MKSDSFHRECFGEPNLPENSARRGRFGGAAILALLLFPLLAACTTAPAKPARTDPFPERAEQRWEALLSGDLETAYTFLSPGYRSTVSLVDWGVSQRMRKVQWNSAEYVSHDCEESRCTVVISAGFSAMAPVPGMTRFENTKRLEETWIKSQDEWWYLPEK